MATFHTKSNGTEKLLSKKDVIEDYNVPPGVLQQMMTRKQIAFIKLGHRSPRFRRSDVETALQRLTVKAQD